MHAWLTNLLLARRVMTPEPMATLLVVLLIVVVTVIALAAVHVWIVPLIHRVASRTPTDWDEICGKHGAFRRIGWLVPALLVNGLAANWLGVAAPGAASILRLIAHLWIWITGLLVLHAVLDAAIEIYGRFPVSRQIPIRGFVQAIKLVTMIVVIIIVIALLMGRSPTLLISGMGAMTAVLMLVFKDPILGLVAGVQLSANRMLAVGDWLEMPKYNADGDVIDITLTTVKVRNWDATITTIPTYALIADSFKNWRGMTEAGGRRIARSVMVDVTSIHFLDAKEIERLRKLHLITDYIKQKIADIECYNQEHGIDPESPVNGRHLTNIGTFRAYLAAYLRKHPALRQDMIQIVRQLQPTAEGVPIQLYAFVSDTRWVQYEGVQADIFDHVFAVAPEFGLRLYQSPSSADIRSLHQSTSLV